MSARAAWKTRLIGLRFGELRFAGVGGVPQSGQLSEYILDSHWTVASGFVGGIGLNLVVRASVVVFSSWLGIAWV